MVGVRAGPDSKQVILLGEGLVVSGEFEISPGIVLSPEIPPLDLATTVEGCESFVDYAAAVWGHPAASFSLVVSDERGGESLVTKAWNALWTFHLLALACRSPVRSFYAMSDGAQPLYCSSSRTPIIRVLAESVEASRDSLDWARTNHDEFYRMFRSSEFLSALRCLGNVAYLQDAEVQIMLLWSGIEGLLCVDAELRRRLALYSALMVDGCPEDKVRYFEMVKQAYDTRSRAVHGGNLKRDKLELGVQDAMTILSDLLARCVELGRVPTAVELDHLAASGSFT
jgi:hypothetical protein